MTRSKVKPRRAGVEGREAQGVSNSVPCVHKHAHAHLMPVTSSSNIDATFQRLCSRGAEGVHSTSLSAACRDSSVQDKGCMSQVLVLIFKTFIEVSTAGKSRPVSDL